MFTEWSAHSETDLFVSLFREGIIILYYFGNFLRFETTVLAVAEVKEDLDSGVYHLSFPDSASVSVKRECYSAYLMECQY